MKLYTEEEIQKHKEIFVKEVRLFGMTFRFYVFKDSKDKYTNLALYKYNFGSKTYEEISVYFLDVMDDEKLDKEIRKTNQFLNILNELKKNLEWFFFLFYNIY